MISNSHLYDNDYIKGLTIPPKPHHYTSKELYDSSSDIHPYSNTLKKKSKVDNSIKTYSWNELYNSKGNFIKYFSTNPLNNRLVSNQGDGKYIVNINNYTKTKVYTTDRQGLVKSAIDPSKGSPIRLNTLSGFKGYLQCLTKNASLPESPEHNIIYLASSPEELQNTLQNETAGANAIGASQGFNFFSSVGSRQVSFSFKVYADYLPAPYIDVLSYCKALLQMNYPTYSSGLVNAPLVRFEYGGVHIIGLPTITCTFGNTIRKGIVDNATVSVSITETEHIVSGKVIL